MENTRFYKVEATFCYGYSFNSHSFGNETLSKSNKIYDDEKYDKFIFEFPYENNREWYTLNCRWEVDTESLAPGKTLENATITLTKYANRIDRFVKMLIKDGKEEREINEIINGKDDIMAGYLWDCSDN